MATFVSSAAATTRYPRAVHAGSNSVSVDYSFSATPSIGDIVHLVRIPDKATVTELVFRGNMAALATGLVVGDSGSTARFIGSFSTSTVANMFRATAGVPHTYSLSDDNTAAGLGTVIQATVTGQTDATQTVANTISLTVFYNMDK